MCKGTKYFFATACLFVLDSGMSSMLLSIYTLDYLNVCVRWADNQSATFF